MKTSKNLKYRIPTELHSQLKQIVVGTDDASADSLAITPLHESSPMAQKLSKHGIRVHYSLKCSQEEPDFILTLFEVADDSHPTLFS